MSGASDRRRQSRRAGAGPQCDEGPACHGDPGTRSGRTLHRGEGVLWTRDQYRMGQETGDQRPASTPVSEWGKWLKGRREEAEADSEQEKGHSKGTGATEPQRSRQLCAQGALGGVKAAQRCGRGKTGGTDDLGNEQLPGVCPQGQARGAECSGSQGSSTALTWPPHRIGADQSRGAQVHGERKIPY